MGTTSRQWLTALFFGGLEFADTTFPTAVKTKRTVSAGLLYEYKFDIAYH